jgi:putative sigma-54 modulation protein
MTTNIQSVHFDADKKLLDFATEKVNKLTTYFEGIISCDIIMRLDKSSTSDNKLVEIKLLMKGNELFSKKQAASFEEAVDLTCEALKTQIKKYKEKSLEKI